MAAPWLAVDPRNTKKVTVPNPEEPGLTIEVGFWPPMQEATLRAHLRDVSIFKEGYATPATTEALAAQNKLDAEWLREAVRWGVRGWTSGEGEPKSLVVTTDGHTALSDESIEVLHRNHLLTSAAVQAVLFNTIGPEGKSGAGSS